MASRQDSYRKSIVDHMPEGDLWEAMPIPASNIYKLLFALAGLFNALHCRADDLTREFHASTCVELCDNWENEIFRNGLQDCIKDLPLDDQERIRALTADRFANGGNQVEYYIEIAKILGFELVFTPNVPSAYQARLELFPLDKNCDPVTKPIRGTSETIVLTTAAESLVDLGVTIDPLTEKIRISFDGDISDIKKVTRYWEDGTLPTQSVGQVAYSNETLEFTRDQALTLELASLGSNRNIHITQYECEFQLLKWRTVCDDVCTRFATTDFDADIHTFICIMEAIMPAHLIFNLFIDKKPYAIIKA